MITVHNKISKQDYIKLYVYWIHRNPGGVIQKLLTILVSFLMIYLLENIKFIPSPFYDRQNEYILTQYLVSGIKIALVLSMLFFIFRSEYIFAETCWRHISELKEMDTYIRDILFAENAVLLYGVIFQKEMILQLFYKDILSINAYDNGIVLFENEMQLPLIIHRDQFKTKDEFEKVCCWVKNASGFGKRYKV